MKLSVTVHVDGADLTRDYIIEDVPAPDRCAEILSDMIASAIRYSKNDNVF